MIYFSVPWRRSAEASPGAGPGAAQHPGVSRARLRAGPPSLHVQTPSRRTPLGYVATKCTQRQCVSVGVLHACSVTVPTAAASSSAPMAALAISTRGLCSTVGATYRAYDCEIEDHGARPCARCRVDAKELRQRQLHLRVVLDALVDVRQHLHHLPSMHAQGSCMHAYFQAAMAGHWRH